MLGARRFKVNGAHRVANVLEMKAKIVQFEHADRMLRRGSSVRRARSRDYLEFSTESR
jgi:hypothetical protein